MRQIAPVVLTYSVWLWRAAGEHGEWVQFFGPAIYHGNTVRVSVVQSGEKPEDDPEIARVFVTTPDGYSQRLDNARGFPLTQTGQYQVTVFVEGDPSPVVAWFSVVCPKQQWQPRG